MDPRCPDSPGARSWPIIRLQCWSKGACSTVLTQGDDDKPKLELLDFGIAKIVAESGATLQTTRAMGTPLYMPPEQIRGDGAIGPRADLHALAHVAYTLLAGALSPGALAAVGPGEVTVPLEPATEQRP